ncbi:hypothetical protein D9619_006935 [Psilocybe cf. subviscida]|uniref:tRNA-splicing endonuclease subunit Sen15 domain-containing protein n=1 Tax=Psilocybe cf. subviscida TaxID=2480587 RepID=A0A8H5B3Q6_9AGAR|nr:hypothetical protein D9619_006935 [Psilocybe cf. subviscida]
MESHPSYPILQPFLVKYPRASSSLFQAYNDIVYAQQWTDVDLVELEACSRAAIKGKKRGSDELLYVVPCALSETISFDWLQNAYKQLFPDRIEPAFIYLAITSSDASIVYYKLSQGIVKPAV